MNLLQLTEMAAAKLCDKCGKTMAANHYWYKGGWKCKAAKPAAEPVAGEQPAEVKAEPQVPPAAPAPAETPGTMPLKQPEKPAAVAAPVVAKPLVIEIEVIAEAMPFLEDELAKINKTAMKVGAQPITVEVIKTEFKEKTRDIRSDDGLGEKRRVTYKQKMNTVRLTGTTPRITGADGSTWNFVGVITPSSQGKALLKLTPTAGDTEGVRKMYSANPYYCDYCNKVRQRNETFIVQSGDQYRQVGRNCLKDFVGGADPQAILNFFAFFDNPDALYNRIFSKGGGDDDGDGYGGGGGRRGAQYYTPEDILATTLAVLDVRGAYVSAKAENGVSTASDVRFAKWGTHSRGTPQSEIDAFKRIHQLMEDPAVKTRAKAIVDWFKALPKEQIEGNTFFQNVSTMIEEDAVEAKMIGYIVGLYPAWRRATQEAETKGGPKLIKDWPAEWGTDPRPVENEHAVVKFVRNLVGDYGTSQLITMMLDNGLSVTWKYSGANKVHDGDEFNITGELQPDNYTNPPRTKFVANRKWLRGAFKD